ncbi:MAG: nitronate monooxygenase, partial [Acidobacteria bacterium]|nr:nitronate monooxygenase [Acidobacteriota bacterium]
MQVSFDNRVTRLLGVDTPILNAPMGGVVTAPFVAAMAEAGAMGMIPASMVRDRDQVRAVRQLTQRPIGANIHARIADKVEVDDLVEDGVRFVTTSLGPVPNAVARMQQAGIRVFHVVTSLDSARRAFEAGVDGLVVEGAEGAALRGVEEIPLMVLLPLVASRIDLPVIAAGGIADGAGMAAAFALGAEGVLMGTRMLASAEAAIHDNYKRAVVSAAATDTVVIDRHHKAPVRVLHTETTARYLEPTAGSAFKELVPSMRRLYENGDMEASFASMGMVAGHIDEVLPVEEILRRTVTEFAEVIARLAAEHRVTRLRASVRRLEQGVECGDDVGDLSSGGVVGLDIDEAHDPVVVDDEDAGSG